MPGWLPIPLLSILLITAASLLISLFLRKVRCPGSPIIAGLVAGLLLGPAFLGRLAPSFHEQLFIGGTPERLALNQLLVQQDVNALLTQEYHAVVNDSSPTSQPHLTSREAESLLQSARWQHQRPLRIFASLLATFLVLSSAFTSFESRPPLRTFAINIGLWSFTIPAAIALFASLLLFDCSRNQSALLACAVGIGPLLLLPFDRRIARSVEPAGPATLQLASRIASALAILIALWAFLAPQPALAPIILPPLLALPFSWLLHIALKRSHVSLRARHRLTRFVIIIHSLLLPPLAALATIHVEIFQHFSIWPTLLILFLADDGRWIGALLGSILTAGREPLPTFRLLMPTLSAGSAQLLITALAAVTHTLPFPIILSLAFGIALIELTSNLRRRIAFRFHTLQNEFPPLDQF